MASDLRIGHGFDVHRFKRGRKLILGGVEIPYALGLAGHSDADVVLHALINAFLGALGKGDIGTHFPDTDPRYKGISSALLFKRVLKMVEQEKFRFINGDITVIAEKPRLAPYSKMIRAKLAALLNARVSRINLKASTAEGLGLIGQGKGMAAMAVVLLARTRQK